jgi:hypothetical protein
MFEIKPLALSPMTCLLSPLMSSFHASQQKVEARWASDLRACGFAKTSRVSLDRSAASRPGNGCPSVETLLLEGGIPFRVGVVSR